MLTNSSSASGRIRLTRGLLIAVALGGLPLAGLILVGSLGEVGATSQASPPGASKAAGPIAGETYLWRPVAIGGGGFITGMSIDRSGATRLVQTDVHGGYRWDAAVDRWVPLVTAASMPEPARIQNGMNEGIFALAVAPGDPKRAYMAIKGRIYRSDDGGHHWIASAAGRPFPLAFDPNGEFRHDGAYLAVDPYSADHVLFGTPADGLWRSLDAGIHFSRVDEVPAGVDMRPARGTQSIGVTVWFGSGANPKVYAASAGHGIFVADSAGGRFSPLSTTEQNQPRFVARAATAAGGAVFAVETDQRAVWRYQNGAWQQLSGKTALSIARYVGLAIDPSGNRILVSDEGGRVWCSVNGGDQWSSMMRSVAPGVGEPPWLKLNDISYFASGQMYFDPAKPNRVWVNGGTGPYFADLGSSCDMLEWKSQVRGIEELVANDVVQRPGRAPLFAAWDFGIHVKPDLNRYSTGFGPKERLLIAAQQLDWSPSDPNFIVTNASDTRMDCCSEDGDAVLAGYSEDGGTTWHKFATLPQPPGTKPDDPWRMSFGTIAVSATDTNKIVWEPAFNRSPFFTRDRGITWHRVVLPGETLPLTGSYEHLYGGRKTLAADRVLKDTFYLYHSGDGANVRLKGLWASSDGGANWRRVFDGEIAPDSKGAAKLRAVPSKSGNLFFTAGVTGGPDSELRRSLDGGAHWTRVPAVDDVDDIAFGKAAAGSAYPTIFVSGKVGGNYGIWRSTDDTKHWQRLAGFPTGRLDQVTVVEGDKDVFGRVYVGYMGSGWLYGEPAACKPGSEPGKEDAACAAVDVATR